MLCDICHDNHATVHLTEIVNERIVEMHICQECAQAKTQNLNEQLQLSGFLGGLTEAFGSSGKKPPKLKCKSCGLLFEEFKKEGRLGCGACYSAFREQLLPLLKKVHGSTRHAGKAPQGIAKVSADRIEIEELRLRLNRAIKLEEYEEAARLRDQMKKLEDNK